MIYGWICVMHSDECSHRSERIAMTMVKTRAVGSLRLLQFSAWIRQHWFLRRIYHLLPAMLRRRVVGSMVTHAREWARFPRTPAWDHSIAPAMPLSSCEQGLRSDLPGINVIGYIRGQFGLAEAAKLYVHALIRAGMDVRLHDVDLGLPHDRNDDSLAALVDETLPHDVTLVFVNPDFLESALEKIGVSKLADKYIIACWFWELETVPSTWIPAVQRVDEIMVATDFIEQAFRRVTDKPLLRVPLPLSALPDSGLQRVDFGLRDDEFIFLTSFDFHSAVERKNPHAVLEAFFRAFPTGDEHVQLLIKTSNGFHYPEKLKELLERAAVDSRIIVRDEIIDRAHFNSLLRCCDAYVSLHRAEGFGLVLAECMAMGKPVVATAWSGNMEFMSSETACLVDYRLVQVREGDYPHWEGGVWAQPCVESAAGAMRRLAESPAAARDLGARAKYSVTELLAPEAAAQKIFERLAQLKKARGMIVNA